MLVSLGAGADHAAEAAKDILTHHDVCIVQEIVVDKFRYPKLKIECTFFYLKHVNKLCVRKQDYYYEFFSEFSSQGAYSEEAWWEPGWKEEKRRKKTSANFLVIGRDSDQVLELILRGRKRSKAEEGELVGGEGRNWLIVTQQERRRSSSGEGRQTNLIRECKPN